MEISRRRSLALRLAALCLMGCATAAGTQPSAMSGQVLASAKSVVLEGETTRITLTAGAADPLRRLTDAARRSTIYLVLDDLKAAQVPAVVYEIYLGLPAGAAANADDPHYVGTLNFFAVAPPNTARRSRSFDVTSIVQMVSRGAPGGGLVVTIIGHRQSEETGEPPSIGTVALVAQ